MNAMRFIDTAAPIPRREEPEGAIMSRFARLFSVPVSLVLTAAVSVGLLSGAAVADPGGDDPPDRGGEMAVEARNPRPPSEDARDEARALRAALAQTKLEVQQLRIRLEEIRAFLDEHDLETTLAEWRAEREALAEARRRLQQERVRLREERHRLQKQMVQQAEREADAIEEAREAAAPRWDARYQMGLIDNDQQVIYVRSHHGSTLVEIHPEIDRKNVKVRGTFENRSEAPWRYTFEIRIAKAERDPKTKRRQVIGSWRYQTPLLGPNDLHEWEVTVPVTDVALIDVVQIGNVKADRPQRIENPDADTNTGEKTAAGTATTGGTGAETR